MRQNRHYQIFWLIMCNCMGSFGFRLDIGAHNFKSSDTDWIWNLWKNFGSNPIAKYLYPFTTATFTKRTCNRCGSLQKRGNVVARGVTGSGVPESTPAGFCVFLSDPVSSEISDLRNFWLHTLYTCPSNILHTKYADKTYY